uniref:Uncharacterized protein n=1 Tax=Myotis myotis TaxID=51298 RepID=A0A7J7UPT3_MYOMY|nr:hypothetical protein mMyoMyo1_008597 [Myotis myotis]
MQLKISLKNALYLGGGVLVLVLAPAVGGALAAGALAGALAIGTALWDSESPFCGWPSFSGSSDLAFRALFCVSSSCSRDTPLCFTTLAFGMQVPSWLLPTSPPAKLLSTVSLLQLLLLLLRWRGSGRGLRWASGTVRGIPSSRLRPGFLNGTHRKSGTSFSIPGTKTRSACSTRRNSATAASSSSARAR